MQVRIHPKLPGIILGAVALLIGLALALPSREPTYKGLTAEQWDSRRGDSERTDAFIILGTNNLPLFVQRIDYNPKKDKLISLYEHLPNWVRKQRWLSDFVGRKKERAFHAMGVLYVLGPLAAPELPHLFQLATRKDDLSALQYIGRMGEPAYPALISLTGHQNPTLAAAAVNYLAAYTNSLQVRQALTHALHDPRPAVRKAAEAALAGPGR